MVIASIICPSIFHSPPKPPLKSLLRAFNFSSLQRLFHLFIELGELWQPSTFIEQLTCCCKTSWPATVPYCLIRIILTFLGGISSRFARVDVASLALNFGGSPAAWYYDRICCQELAHIHRNRDIPSHDACALVAVKEIPALVAIKSVRLMTLQAFLTRI